MSELPTARTTLASNGTLEIWCKGCRHAVSVDLQKLVDDGKGDVQ